MVCSVIRVTLLKQQVKGVAKGTRRTGLLQM